MRGLLEGVGDREWGKWRLLFVFTTYLYFLVSFARLFGSESGSGDDFCLSASLGRGDFLGTM